jgi:hypothetical protein
MRAVLVGSVAPSPAAGSGLSGQSGGAGEWAGSHERLESSVLGRSWRGSWPGLAARAACAGAVLRYLESVIEGTPATRPIPAARALLSIDAWGLACVKDARWVGGGLGFQLVRAVIPGARLRGPWHQPEEADDKGRDTPRSDGGRAQAGIGGGRVGHRPRNRVWPALCH